MAERTCREPFEPGLPGRGRRRLARGVPAGSRNGGHRARPWPARARRREGRFLRDPRADPARVGAPRLRPRPDRSRRGADLPVEHRDRGLLHPRALERRRLPGRRRRAARQDRGRAPRARLHARDTRRASCARPRARVGSPGRPGRGARPDRRRRPLHVHLHVRDDRPAQGLHDPQPQLLRDGRKDRPDRELLPPERRPAPLPAARTQLRAAHAPAGRAPRLHDRVPARPAPHRRGDAGGEADGPPDRAARAGEGAHRGHRELRGRNRRQAPTDRLGARGGPAGEPSAPAARAASRGSWRSSTGSQTGSSTRRSRSAWAGGSAPRSRGARHSRRRSRSSSTRWTSSSSRATARRRRQARRT